MNVDSVMDLYYFILQSRSSSLFIGLLSWQLVGSSGVCSAGELITVVGQGLEVAAVGGRLNYTLRFRISFCALLSRCSWLHSCGQMYDYQDSYFGCYITLFFNGNENKNSVPTYFFTQKKILSYFEKYFKFGIYKTFQYCRQSNLVSMSIKMYIFFFIQNPF